MKIDFLDRSVNYKDLLKSDNKYIETVFKDLEELNDDIKDKELMEELILKDNMNIYNLQDAFIDISDIDEENEFYEELVEERLNKYSSITFKELLKLISNNKETALYKVDENYLRKLTNNFDPSEDDLIDISDDKLLDLCSRIDNNNKGEFDIALYNFSEESNIQCYVCKANKCLSSYFDYFGKDYWYHLIFTYTIVSDGTPYFIVFGNICQ